jgi:hypothetical protein
MLKGYPLWTWYVNKYKYKYIYVDADDSPLTIIIYIYKTMQLHPDQFFKNLQTEVKDIPVWVGELYFEYHRGTYTTQGREKLIFIHFIFNFFFEQRKINYTTDNANSYFENLNFWLRWLEFISQNDINSHERHSIACGRICSCKSAHEYGQILTNFFYFFYP